MSPYLSRLCLDMRSRQVINEITHPYEMHRTLMRGYASAGECDGDGARHKHGVLFRADVDQKRGVVKVYVQSTEEPDWSFLDRVDRYLLETGQGPAHDCKDITRSLERIQEDQLLSFRLRANPTKRVVREGDPLNGKQLTREDEQLAWLEGKGLGGREGVPGGFALAVVKGGPETESVVSVQVRSEGKVSGRKKGLAPGQVMTHLSVLFEGRLRVTDPDAFRSTIVGGIGSAKAYGFGLLSIAPVTVPGTDLGP
jgi:CRISPR system Cascade subunit CasE